MDFGLIMFPTAESIPVTELGRRAEGLGYESVWFPEHTHIPVRRESPWPGGAELPYEYPRGLDPFVALAAVASVTSRLRLATGVCLVVEHDPIVLAKVVASLDQLSNGRVLFGVGGGWNLEEMRNHGTDPKRRWAVLRERIGAIKAIWTQDEAEYHGEHVSFDPLWAWPKPVQKPHPPVIIGGNGPHTLQRVLEYGDGWFPIVGRANTAPIEPRIDELRALERERGRTPVPISLFGVRAEAAELERYARAGVERCVFQMPSAPAEVVAPRMERFWQAAREFV
jgi:probable F420-dependent oxidoreductase